MSQLRGIKQINKNLWKKVLFARDLLTHWVKHVSQEAAINFTAVWSCLNQISVLSSLNKLFLRSTVKFTQCWEPKKFKRNSRGLMMLNSLAPLYPFWRIFQLGFFHWWKSQQGGPRVGFLFPGHRHRESHPPRWLVAASDAISHRKASFATEQEMVINTMHNGSLQTKARKSLSYVGGATSIVQSRK